jgi:hypothetical protein
MSPSPFFPSAILAEVHRNDISRTAFRFEFVCQSNDIYVVSRFDVSAQRLLDVRPGTELELGSDYYPGRLHVQIRASTYTKYDLVSTMRPMAQTYRFMRPGHILGGLLVREEASEPHFTYLVSCVCVCVCVLCLISFSLFSLSLKTSTLITHTHTHILVRSFVSTHSTHTQTHTHRYPRNILR